MSDVEKGAYLLLIKLEHDRRVEIGRLGCFDFAAGYYAYCGSAYGPGGLVARVTRHVSSAKNKHWHIDYLMAHAEIVRVGLKPNGKECSLIEDILRVKGGDIPVQGFGSSDCTLCDSHLVYFVERPNLATLQLTAFSL